jgi:hypothetical protein
MSGLFLSDVVCLSKIKLLVTSISQMATVSAVGLIA